MDKINILSLNQPKFKAMIMQTQNQTAKDNVSKKSKQ